MIPIAKLNPAYRDFHNPMNFLEFLNTELSEDQRAYVASLFDYDHRAHKIFFEPYFRALVLHSCTQDESLQDLKEAVNDDPLYARHGAHLEVSTSALSQANANRPVEPLLLLLQQVLETIERLPHSAKVLRQVNGKTLAEIADLLDSTSIFDATTFSLPSKIARWAQTRQGQAGFKLQLRLRSGYGGPDKVMFTSAAGNDCPYFTALLDLEEGAGEIYLFDAGYFKIKTYEQITDSGNFFVTTRHSKIHCEILKEQPVPQVIGASGYTIHSEHLVHLGQGDNRTETQYRLLDVTDSRGRRIEILTNLLTPSAEVICLLRRYRWTVETVIRWLKSQLRLKHLISYSPRGIVVQVVMALIVYGLMVLYHQNRAGDTRLSLVKLLRQIRYDFHQALIDYGYQLGLRDGLQQAAGLSPPG